MRKILPSTTSLPEIPSPAELRKPWTPQTWPRAVQLLLCQGPSNHTLQQASSPNQHALKHTAKGTGMEQLLPGAQLLRCHLQTGSNLRLNTQLLIFGVWVDNFARMKLKALRGHSN